MEENYFNIDNILRCPECNLISSLKLKYKNDNQIIIYSCENGHEGNILLKDYINQINKYSLSKEKCSDCGKSQNEINNELLYCAKCSKFICYLCGINHKNNKNDKHVKIDYQKYDSLCKIHYNSFVWYCVECRKNLCAFCKIDHESHNKIELHKITYPEESIFKLRNEINELENKIKSLENIKKEINILIDQYIKSSELDIKFLKYLYYSYEYEVNQNNNLNYNLINNLRTISTNIIKNYETISNEGTKFISYFNKIKNEQSNSLSNNFKTIRVNTGYINHLDILKDGRLASCSDDYTLKIYSKNSINVEISIKVHSKRINSFTQLKDGRIISCSADNTMKIIKLIDENKFIIEQTLIGHSSDVYKVIEIKENELISISKDKTMKIWKQTNENKYQLITSIMFQNQNSNCNILKLTNNEFVTSSQDDKCLKFWNNNNYELIYLLNEIRVPWTLKNLCLIENDILCVGGGQSKGFYLIKISNHQIIKNIIGPKIIWSINKCFDGLFLCSIVDENNNNSIVKYMFKDNNFIKIYEKEKAHEDFIFSCVELKDVSVASGGKDKIIKLWND